MNCDCYDFCQEVVTFSEKILAEGDGILQWKQFEQFLVKYIGKAGSPDSSDPESSSPPRCSIHICSHLFRNLIELRSRGIALSTLLVDLMATLNFDDCASFSVPFLADFDERCGIDLESSRIIGAFRWNLDNTFMKLLLNFGFLSSLSGDCLVTSEELLMELEAFMYGVADDPSDITQMRDDALKLLKNTFRRGDQDNDKRAYFAVSAIRAVKLHIRGQNLYSEQCIKCLRMYFAGTQDAFLTVFEVRSVLYVCFLLLNKLNLFSIYCQGLEAIMPECPARMEPRKLTHLSRCQIRKYLKMSNLPLPSAIDKLFYPKLLLPMSFENFLLGDEVDISRETEKIEERDKLVTLSELELLFSEPPTP